MHSSVPQVEQEHSSTGVSTSVTLVIPKRKEITLTINLISHNMSPEESHTAIC